MRKPKIGDFAPHYQVYIDLVEEGDFLKILDENTVETIAFFQKIPPEKHGHRYAPGKWTIKDVLLHINDTERGMSYRALVGARGDAITPLFPMDEVLYAANADTSGRTILDLLAEFEAVRFAMRKIFEHLPAAQLDFRANSGGVSFITPRALGYIMLGHVLHHVKVIQERYLN
jgi:DinB superfamily